MPSLASIALRYLIWLIAVRVLHIAAVNFLGFPDAPATTVILVAVPAAEIGLHVARRVPVWPEFRDWLRIWGVLVSVHLLMNVIVPAILVAQVRDLLATPEGLRTPVIVAAATAAMLALFLWVGARAARAR